MMNDPEKTKTLCSESKISAGKVETNPTIVAPNPIETRSAGSAQHTKVLIEVKSPKKEIQMFF
jgi:hypothetical protein